MLHRFATVSAALLLPLAASAQVTVQVGQNTKGFGYRLETTNSQGTPITTITAGSTFFLRVFIQDLRPDDGDGDGLDERGIFASYLDLLYDSNIVSTVDDPTNPLGFVANFNSTDYGNGISGSDDTLNIIDELGAFQSLEGGAGLFSLSGPTRRDGGISRLA